MGTLRDFLEQDLDLYQIEYRVHATRRMFEREVFGEDVEEVLSEGEIIEQYDENLPLRHLLLNGRVARRPLHVAIVVSLADKRITVITVYEPEGHRWTKNFSKRR